MASEKMYSVREAADKLKLSPIRVRQFCHEKRLGTKVGNYYVITEEELERFAQIERPRGVPKKKHTDRA